MTSRCKFYCEAVEKRWNAYAKQFEYGYKFRAVTGDSPENKEFFLYTPAGHLEVSLVRSDAFVPGREYYLDISEITLIVAEAPKA